jgi:hypothetical protein
MSRMLMPTPTAAARRTALCAVRGALQVLHNAATLVRPVDLDAERMLRTAEGLARASVARLEFVHRSVVSTSSAPAPAPAAGRPYKDKKKKKNGVNHELMTIDGNPAAGGVPAAAAAPVAFRMSPHAPAFAPGPAAASARVLVKKSSRERSPRRVASLTPPASSLAPPSATAVNVDGYSVGQAVVLVGLVSRPELTGISATLHSFEGTTSRWAVVLDTTGEAIRVKAGNLRPSIFMPGALAARAAGAPG